MVARREEEQEERDNPLGPPAWVWKVLTVAVVAVLLAGGIYLGIQSRQNQKVLDRQDCIAQVNGVFFGHLADALAQQPATIDRQDFLDKMKSDADMLKHLQRVCPS